MKKWLYTIVSSAVVSMITMSYATASAIDITYDTVGELADATFGGSGIPNDMVAITTYQEEICTTRCRPSGLNITLGLAAHGRYENLLDGNDGAGTYYASAGSNTPPSSTLEGATWNFDYYIDIENGSFDDYSFNLFYDFDPAADNDISTHGFLDINAALQLFSQDPLSDISRTEGSQNLMFGFLSMPSPFVSVPAPVSSFDPNAAGEYTFALVAYKGQSEVARTAILVDVKAIPEPGVLALFGIGLLALGGRRLSQAA